MSGKIVESKLQGRYQVLNNSRDVSWICDEPIEDGGTNEGPTPKELLISSLTCCKLITMKMYAERKGWDIGETQLTLTRVDDDEKIVLEKRIKFPSHLSEEQKKRLTVISGKCPIAKSLSSSVEFI